MKLKVFREVNLVKEGRVSFEVYILYLWTLKIIDRYH